MLQIKIKHSFIVDIKIFFQTLRYKKWLDDNGYFYFLFDRKIFKNFNYVEFSQEIMNKLSPYWIDLEKKISTNKEYEIYLTRFGTFGSYEMPNKVFVNIFRTPNQITETVIHELVHLQLEPEVLRNKISHWEKEEKVDLIVDGILKK